MSDRILEMSKCVLCGSNKNSIYYSFINYKLISCSNCDLKFVWNSKDVPDLVDLNIQKYNNNDWCNIYFSKKEEIKKRADKYITILKKYQKYGNVLDVGCSYGFILEVFLKSGYNAEGIDISYQVVKYLTKKNIPVIKGNFTSYKFRKKYNCILFLDSIEHFENPLQIINRAKKILEKDGMIIIQTPNINSIMSLLCGKKWFWLLTPEHRCLFSTNSLMYLINKSNLSVVHYETWDDSYEFANNLLAVLHVPADGFFKIFHYILHMILSLIIKQLSLFWRIWYLGGEHLIYVSKK